MILIVTIILAWMFIGIITVIINSFIKEINLDYTDVIIAMVAGPATIAMLILFNLENSNSLPKWMSKSVIEHIK